MPPGACSTGRARRAPLEPAPPHHRPPPGPGAGAPRTPLAPSSARPPRGSSRSHRDRGAACACAGTRSSASGRWRWPRPPPPRPRRPRLKRRSTRCGTAATRGRARAADRAPRARSAPRDRTRAPRDPRARAPHCARGGHQPAAPGHGSGRDLDGMPSAPGERFRQQRGVVRQRRDHDAARQVLLRQVVLRDERAEQLPPRRPRRCGRARATPSPSPARPGPGASPPPRAFRDAATPSTSASPRRATTF